METDDKKNSNPDIDPNEYLYPHIKELAQVKYNDELRREDSLIQQSGRMQTAFSFITVVLCMVVPILLEHRGPLSIKFFFIAFSLIFFCLLISLVFASIAQWRWKRTALSSILEIEEFLKKNYESVSTNAQRCKQYVTYLAEAEKSKTCLNDRRVNLIMISMYTFFFSIFLIFIFYAIGTLLAL